MTNLSRRSATWRLRPHQPGDLGMVIHQQTRIYCDEYGWGGEFEALVAEIAARFIRSHDPAREHCWVAEDIKTAHILGSVMLVRKTSRVAQLRMLYVDASARGTGLGGALVDTCIAFARDKEYRKLVLWTNDVLTDARALYVKRGFALTASEPHTSFGKKLIGQFWELKL
jgi:GNAT superfamily N-acetyltransferase